MVKPEGLDAGMAEVDLRCGEVLAEAVVVVVRGRSEGGDERQHAPDDEEDVQGPPRRRAEDAAPEGGPEGRDRAREEAPLPEAYSNAAEHHPVEHPRTQQADQPHGEDNVGQEHHTQAEREEGFLRGGEAASASPDA